MCDQRLFAPQIEALTRAGLNCEVGDLQHDCTIEGMAALVLRRAPRRFALAGLSMGGIVALEVYRQAPDRISHLALLNTTARADAAGAIRKKQLSRVAKGELELVLREELKPQYLAPANRTPERLRILESMGTRLGSDVFCRQTIALIGRRNYFDVLEHIACPTLLLAGALDTVCPVDRHEEISARIVDCRFEILENCGHISTLEQPERVNAALISLMSRPGAQLTRNGLEKLKVISPEG
jgi:pimeloyl-ACP methyl ester carboxylesterase